MNMHLETHLQWKYIQLIKINQLYIYKHRATHTHTHTPTHAHAHTRYIHLYDVIVTSRNEHLTPPALVAVVTSQR